MQVNKALDWMMQAMENTKMHDAKAPLIGDTSSKCVLFYL